MKGGILHLHGSFSWVRLGSSPLHPGRFYLGWGQGPTISTAFGDRMGSSPPPGVRRTREHNNWPTGSLPMEEEAHEEIEEEAQKDEAEI
uniref:Uncharacterized protein n=1 Tax=Brassica oleracea var. oleracea TaxID=109376 RepID=A0A0D3BB10_BRAOL